MEESEKKPTGLEKMVEKAKLMVRTGRVTRIDRLTYQVIGDHGVYVVVRGVDGNFHCGCQGYMTRGFCSHALAVNLIEERIKSRRKPLQAIRSSESEGEKPEEFEDNTDQNLDSAEV